jgi:hypothetical protein
MQDSIEFLPCRANQNILRDPPSGSKTQRALFFVGRRIASRYLDKYWTGPFPKNLDNRSIIGCHQVIPRRFPYKLSANLLDFLFQDLSLHI